jgi:O-antigen/teichoic acid export membrane protein
VNTASRWIGGLRFLATFGLTRGGLFVAPILLANLLVPADYGRLEFAQAVAAVAGPVLSLGTASAVPLALVSRAAGVSWGAIVLHHATVTGLLLLALLIVWTTSVTGRSELVLWCVVALGLQALWSVVLRSQGRSEASLLLDAGFWLSAFGAAALALLMAVPLERRGPWIMSMVALYALALAATVARSLSCVDLTEARRAYASTLRTGLSLMTITVLAMLAVSLGRIGVGYYSTPESTADYGALFRATAAPIVAHQIVLVARFRQVFEWPIERVQRTLPWIVSLVTACVLAFWALSPMASTLLGSAFASAFAQHRVAGLMVLSQCILWSAIALNDLVITRQQCAAAVARASAGYFILALPAAAWLLGQGRPDLRQLVSVHSALMLGYYLVQSFSMWRSGITLSNTWVLAATAFATLSLAAPWL